MPKRKFQQGSQGGSGGSSVTDDQEEQRGADAYPDADANAVESDNHVDDVGMATECIRSI